MTEKSEKMREGPKLMESETEAIYPSIAMHAYNFEKSFSPFQFNRQRIQNTSTENYDPVN